jgi:hypothetical protein
MHGRKLVIGAAIAMGLALGATGTTGAHWDSDWDDHGMMGPGMMGGHGVMGPGMMDPDLMEPPMMEPGMGPYPHDWWDD